MDVLGTKSKPSTNADTCCTPPPLQLTLRIRASLNTRLVMDEASTYTEGSTTPHSITMPQGSGSSISSVISKPVRSSTLKTPPSTSRAAGMLMATSFR